MTILYDLADPAELTFYVRDTPEPSGVALNAILPDVMVNDVEATISRVERTNRAAQFRAWDAESPIGKRDSFARDRIGMPPISQKTVIGEYDSLMLERLRGSTDTTRIVDAIYDDVDLNARAIRIRAELARGDVLDDFKFTLTAENGLTLEADYGAPAGHTPTYGTAWSNTTTGTVIADLQAWLAVYEDAGGVAGGLVTSRLGASYIMQNAGVRALAAANGVTPDAMSLTRLNDVFTVMGFPPVRIYNSRFDVGGAATRAIREDRLLIVPENPRDLGMTAWGITAEALELAEANRLSLDAAPGLVSVVTKSADPVQTWTKVGGVVLPIIENPNRLIVAEIY